MKPPLVALAVCLVAITLLPACVFPHRAYRTPVIHGTMTSGARPMANLPLRVVAEPATEFSCAGKNVLETLTVADGQFRFCPMTDFQFLMHVMAHWHFKWHVCAKIKDEWTVVQRSTRYTLVDEGPQEIERLECEIAGGVKCSRVTDDYPTREKLRAALGTQRCVGVSK